jgi:Uma2 family endonuclease
MSDMHPWTVTRLRAIEADEWYRYELIDGELIMSEPEHWSHQHVASCLASAVRRWDDPCRYGLALTAPGVILDELNCDVPDAMWISRARMRHAVDADGHFTVAPELMVEVLSPGCVSEHRDRHGKMALYAREDVQEYWIVDWQRRTVEVYSRTGESLTLARSLAGDDLLETPLLPGFSVPLTRIWPPAL